MKNSLIQLIVDLSINFINRIKMDKLYYFEKVFEE